MTREPGNLLPVMVKRERVGRGAPKRRCRAGFICRFGAKGQILRTGKRAWRFGLSPSSRSVSTPKIAALQVPSRVRVRSLHLSLGLTVLTAVDAPTASAQNSQTLNPVEVSPATPRAASRTGPGTKLKACRSGPSARRGRPRRNRRRPHSQPLARKPCRRRRAVPHSSYQRRSTATWLRPAPAGSASPCTRRPHP